MKGIHPFVICNLSLEFAEEALYGVFHEAGDGHRTYASRNRGDYRCLRLYRGIVDVTAELAGLRIAVYSDVDDNRSFRNHVGSHKLWTAYGNNKDFRIACDCRQVNRTAVRNSHCSILIKEEFCYRKAYDIASAYDYGTLALDFYSCHLEHLDYALRCAWQSAFLLLPESCDIERMESVNILLLGYRRDDLIRSSLSFG